MTSRRFREYQQNELKQARSTGKIGHFSCVITAEPGLTNKRQEVSRSDKKRQEVSRSVKNMFLLIISNIYY